MQKESPFKQYTSKCQGQGVVFPKTTRKTTTKRITTTKTAKTKRKKGKNFQLSNKTTLTKSHFIKNISINFRRIKKNQDLLIKKKKKGFQKFHKKKRKEKKRKFEKRKYFSLIFAFI